MLLAGVVQTASAQLWRPPTIGWTQTSANAASAVDQSAGQYGPVRVGDISAVEGKRQSKALRPAPGDEPFARNAFTSTALCAFEGADNCTFALASPDTITRFGYADADIWKAGGGATAADDIIPQASPLSRMCIETFYWDPWQTRYGDN